MPVEPPNVSDEDFPMWAAISELIGALRAPHSQNLILFGVLVKANVRVCTTLIKERSHTSRTALRSRTAVRRSAFKYLKSRSRR